LRRGGLKNRTSGILSSRIKENSESTAIAINKERGRLLIRLTTRRGSLSEISRRSSIRVKSSHSSKEI